MLTVTELRRLTQWKHRYTIESYAGELGLEPETVARMLFVRWLRARGRMS